MGVWLAAGYPGGQVVTTGDPMLAFKTPPRIGVLHSTEGDSFPHYDPGKAPHATVDPLRSQWQQHFQQDRAAFALRAPGGISTNTWGAIQVEIVGRAATLKDLSGEPLNYLLGFLNFFFTSAGIPLVSSVQFGGGETYGLDGSVRLSRDAWYAYTGILGHQHVPANLHWDPGAIPIQAWLGAMVGHVDNPLPPPPPPPPAPVGIAEDGWFGTGTIAEIQRQAGTPVDGELWYQYGKNAQPAFTSGWVYNYAKGKGSPAWAWVQGRLGTAQDGVFGQSDLAAMEHRAGFPYDGVLSGPSNTVRWFQHALNTHTL
jgi:hypothetical protein